MTPKTIHCANGALYMLMSIAAAACAAWAIASGRVSGVWHLAAALAGVGIAMLWGAYYALLRWEVNADGISRCLLRRRFYPWQSLQHAQVQQSDAGGVATCCLVLRFAEGELELSSRLISIDALEELRDELAAAGLLTLPQKEQNRWI